jgi:tetratricopeptide (TPR) repeat protein
MSDLFRAGLAHHQRGDLNAAREAYRLAVEASPAHADALHMLGVVAYQTKNNAEAAFYLEKAIRLDGRQAHYRYNYGGALRNLGRLAEAEQELRSAIALRKDYPEAHYNLGNLLKETGRFADACDCYRQALRHRPHYLEAHNNLGTTLRSLGKPNRAVVALRKAARIAPESPEVCNNLGLALRDLGEVEQAVAQFRDALRLRPNFADAAANLWFLLGQTGRLEEARSYVDLAARLRPNTAQGRIDFAHMLRKMDRHAEALPHYETALQQEPGRADAQKGYGEALRKVGRLVDSETTFREVRDRFPQLAESHNDLGNPLHELGRYQEAIACYRHAIELNPNYPDAHANLGNVMRDLGRIDEAETCLQTAIRLKPDFAEAHFNLGTVHLVSGRLATGWPEFEWRFECFPKRRLPKPRWQGEKLSGRTLLVHAEQGIGDTIQFCRFVPALGRQAKVVLEVQPSLTRLLADLPGIAQIVAQGDALPDFDLHCPLMSLPFVQRTTLETIPEESPYLAVPAEANARWSARLDPYKGLRIGLTWAGNPTYGNDRNRSIDLRQLEPLLDIPGTVFVSLQKSTASAEVATLTAGLVLHDWTRELNDFADTAALIAALDMVISVDTAVAHLAGALGRTVWLLNRFDTCWRWLRERTDSPWYPTLRQFRQTEPGDWSVPIAAMRAELLARRHEPMSPQDCATTNSIQPMDAQPSDWS